MSLKTQILETINQNNFDELVKYIEESYISIASCLVQYIANENIEGLSFLLDNYEYDVVNFTYKNINILTLVSQYGWIDAVKLLLQHDIPVETTSKYFKNPLYIALVYDQQDLIDYLLENNKEMINTLLDDNSNIIHLIVHLHNSSLLKYVLTKLDNNTLINQQNKFGLTPLHMAVMANELEMVKTLVENKVDVTILNNKSQTALEIASNEDYSDIFNFLNNNSQMDYFENITLGS